MVLKMRHLFSRNGKHFVILVLLRIHSALLAFQKGCQTMLFFFKTGKLLFLCVPFRDKLMENIYFTISTDDGTLPGVAAIMMDRLHIMFYFK